jgi:cytoskeletal protein CcmA (bactofilin family)
MPPRVRDARRSARAKATNGRSISLEANAESCARERSASILLFRRASDVRVGAFLQREFTSLNFFTARVLRSCDERRIMTLSSDDEGAAMLNFGKDRIADAKTTGKPALKPALYDPPGAAAKPAPNPLRPPAPSPPLASPAPPVLTDVAPATAPPVASAAATETPGSKLSVGVNIKLKGVDISDCDVLVIEGSVEATVHSKTMQIASPGTLKGTAVIDVAEIEGEFAGELTARTRLVVHGTGRVSGTIRYGKLIVAEGGELSGDVKRLEPNGEPRSAPGTPPGHGAGASSSH